MYYSYSYFFFQYIILQFLFNISKIKYYSPEFKIIVFFNLLNITIYNDVPTYLISILFINHNKLLLNIL